MSQTYWHSTIRFKLLCFGICLYNYIPVLGPQFVFLASVFINIFLPNIYSSWFSILAFPQQLIVPIYLFSLVWLLWWLLDCRLFPWSESSDAVYFLAKWSPHSASRVNCPASSKMELSCNLHYICVFLESSLQLHRGLTSFSIEVCIVY